MTDRRERPFHARGQDPVRAVDLGGRVPPHNGEAEACVLSAALSDARALGIALDTLEPGHFYSDANKRIFGAAQELHRRGQPVDTQTVAAFLKDRERLQAIGGIAYLAKLVDATPAVAHVAAHAAIVREKARIRKLVETCQMIAAAGYGDYGDADEFIGEAESAVFEIRSDITRSERGMGPIREAVHEGYRRVQERKEGKRMRFGITTGIRRLNGMTGGLKPRTMIVVAARPSMGKAQPIDAMVRTPSGWTRIGDLVAGNAVASVDDRPSRVLGVYDQGERQVFRVTFADGRSAECCAEHLWRVRHRLWQEWRVLSTADLVRLLRSKRNQHRIWIETPDGHWGDRAKLPVDPWVLGALLGDGCLRSSCVGFTTADQQMVNKMRVRVRPDQIVAQPPYGYRIVSGRRKRSATRVALDAMGLMGHASATKFVPEAYKKATRESRVALLQGLLDTDGWVEKHGSVCFCSTSRRLARDVVDIARSLGAICSVHRRGTETYVHRGERRACLTAYVVTISHPNVREFLSLQRKVDRIRSPRRQRRLTITTIEPSRIAKTRCIRVSHPDGTYITTQDVVTHNSSLAMNIVEAAAGSTYEDCEVGCVVFSIEDTREDISDRCLSAAAKVDLRRYINGKGEPEDEAHLLGAVHKLERLPIWIEDPEGLRPSLLCARVQRLKSDWERAPEYDAEGKLTRLGRRVRIVVVDYLQLMEPDERVEKREERIASLSRALKRAARSLGVCLIAVSQLNRVAESRSDKRPQLSDLRESGQIEQDADLIVLLFRAYYYLADKTTEEAQKAKRLAEAIVAKQRGGPTGTVHLEFVEEHTRFSDPPAGAT